ncbi:hypothetical protein ACFV2I_30825 [Streptomyces microflavus]|uniref:Uncharacterized protein n=1 Tax=Streptomyces microflavus TaxID=1919 RepID=A0A7H8MKW1_STRMI|nr:MULTISPECIES: hypothetical protein [Streptomyces]MBK3588536.1 hypothetical protein [Streptomyces sp. MBT57]MBW3358611.1 hypothetical protein [Streptomyces sp. 09ZI22]MEE1731760.1 hypothetical protein [Streptomyces sp. BE282]QKW43167.1 hypothetical protein HUT09_11700 [Streptomyces microflavus]QQZ54278.1 hypothetical protein IFE09_12065 [Streptomyces microflavus]
MLHIGQETGSRTTATNPTTTPTDPVPARTPTRPAPADQSCDLVTVPARQGLEAVDILRRGRDHEAVGPVLHNGACDTLGFLVPPGTADAWDVPGSACTRTDGRGLRLPTTPPAAGSGWLLPPAEDAPVTDPAVLRAALDQAARLLEAADGCS